MKKLLLTLLTLMATIAVNAGQVSRQQALQKALKFMPDKQFGETKAYARSESSSDTEPFYIFNVVNNGGFVIVSGDDRMKSILGYAEHGNFDLNDMPENVRWWLGQYEKAILSLNNTTPAPIVKRSATRGTSEAKEDIAPFITTYWGQHAPYNSQCPTYNNENCITGCIATAMAQVMNYTKWPESATSEIASYTTETLSLSVPKLSATTFNWDSMADDDIARLMRYCGQAVGMDYGLESSGAYDARIPGALIGKFGYDNGIRIIYRNGYNSETWEGMIYNELKAGRPVIYGGQSGKGGHSFICHGYREGMFYINWGWNGNWDGYFALTALNPDGTGSYGKDQTAVIGIQKPTGGAIVSNPMVTVTKVELTSDETVSRASSSANFTDIAIKSTLQHAFMEDKTVQVGFALYQSDVLKQVLASGNIAFSPGLNAMFSATFAFGSGLVNGTYRIVPVYRESETSDWIADEGSDWRYVEAVIAGTNLKLKVMPDAAHDERLTFRITDDKYVSVLAANEHIAGDIVIPSSVIINNVEYIVNNIPFNAFGRCDNLTSISLPTTIKTIGSAAFYGCNSLTSFTIPKTLEYIDGNPFGRCYNLRKIVVDENNPNIRSINGGLYCKSLADDEFGLISYPLGIDTDEIVVEEGSSFLGSGALDDNSNVKRLILPESLTRIGNIRNCMNLEEIVFSNNISFLGDIYDCPKLLNIMIFPDRSPAFYGCSGLKTIIVKSFFPPIIENRCFEASVYEQATLFIPIGRTDYYQESVGWQNFKNIVEMDMPDVTSSTDPFDNITKKQMILGYYAESELKDWQSFGGGKEGIYKAAIMLPKEKMMPFKNNEITHIRFGLNDDNIQNVKLWIGSTLDDEDIYSQEVPNVYVGWNVVALNEPVKIEGNNICIGIEYYKPSDCYPILCTWDITEEGSGSGLIYGPYGDNGTYVWDGNLTTGGGAKASLSIQALVKGDELPQYDLKLTSLSGVKTFYGKDEPVDLVTGFAWLYIHFKNVGKNILQNYKIKYCIDGENEKNFDEWHHNINSNSDWSFSFPSELIKGLNGGTHELKVYISEIEGEKPKYTLDDTLSVKLRIVEKDVPRQKILLEHNTATWCPHSISTDDHLKSVFKSNNNVAYVRIHQTDELSCDACEYYGADFLPNCSWDRTGEYLLRLTQVDDHEEYKLIPTGFFPAFASINISVYYSNNNRIKVIIRGRRTKDFQKLINFANLYVMLTEDNLYVGQADEDLGYVENYCVNGVLRGNVSSLSGDVIKWNGDSYEMSYEYKLKSEWKRENMHIVAYIGNSYNDKERHYIINAETYDMKDAELVESTDVFEEDNMVYEKLDENTVAIYDVDNSNGEVVIPKTVTHDGKEYLVTAISDDAFKGNTSLTKVTIPESIGHIGNNAFAGCIGLQIIYCYATEPIALGSEKVTVRTRAVSGEMPTSTVFAEVNKESCILYVPKKCGEKYRNADGWCEFQNILEMVSDILGDANNDGNLDQKDIDAVIHYIMTGDTNNFIFDNANVNGDNKVDIADIVLLVNIIRHTQP